MPAPALGLDTRPEQNARPDRRASGRNVRPSTDVRRYMTSGALVEDHRRRPLNTSVDLDDASRNIGYRPRREGAVAHADVDSSRSALPGGAYPGAYPCDTPGIQMDGMDERGNIRAGQRLAALSADPQHPPTDQKVVGSNPAERAENTQVKRLLFRSAARTS